MTSPTRTAEVALSVEALLHQWARQSDAPAGAAVVAGTEISARRRGGIEWRTPDAVAVSVLARPGSLDPASADVGWVAASLAAVRALDSCLGGERSCLWPDSISGPGDDPDVAVNAACTLGPGRVELAVLAVRAGPVTSPDQRTELVESLLDRLRETALMLDDPYPLLDAYRARCSTLGRAVELRRLPHGTIRGLAADIDDAGRLVLESPTGLKERIAVSALNSVRVLPDQAR